MAWKREIPKEDGKYWAWCERDGDMMVVDVMNVQHGTIIKNSAGETIGVIGDAVGVTFEQFASVFSHFTPYIQDRPRPPANVSRKAK